MIHHSKSQVWLDGRLLSQSNNNPTKSYFKKKKRESERMKRNNITRVTNRFFGGCGSKTQGLGGQTELKAQALR
jgi:hypothetical protein